MKKWLALLLAAAMIFSLSACAPSADGPAEPTESSPGTQSGKPVDTEGRTIGINNWFTGVYSLDVLVDNAEFALGICGDSVVEYNNEGNAEKVISDMENMISAGVDGILWLGMFENNFVSGPKIPNDAKTWFAFYDKIPSGADVLQNVREMEYFAGGVGTGNYAAGKIMAETALADGCTKALLAAAEIGDPTTDARVAGFVETFEAGGGTMLSVTRTATGEANGELQVCENMLAAFPEADALYCTGQAFTLGALSAVSKAGVQDQVKVYGTDLDPNLLEYLKDGSLAACCGGHWTSALFTTVLLMNAMDGHVMLDDDGLPVVLNEETGVPFISVPSKYAELYQRFFIDENPYEEEELKALLYRYNPDVTVDDLKETVQSYTIENRLLAKYAAGKITAEELEAVGISVS